MSFQPLQTIDDLTMFSQLSLYTTSQPDYHQLLYILKDLLCYPSDRLADLHQKSNTLGTFDLPEGRTVLKSALLDNLNYEICFCCYSVKQTKIGYCRQIHQIIPLNESTKLFFNDMKYCIVLLCVMLVVYSVYSFVTNMVAYGRIMNCLQNRICRLAAIGLGSKLYDGGSKRHRDMYIIETYLGLLMVIVWAIILILKIYQQGNISRIQNMKSPTVSNFTLIFKGIPKEYTKERLQSVLDEYAQRMRNKNNIIIPNKAHHQVQQYDMGFTIKTFNLVREYYETLKISKKEKESFAEQQLKLKTKQLKNIILDRGNIGSFPMTKVDRLLLYQNINNYKREIAAQRIQKLKHIQQTFKYLNKGHTKTVFVTFNHSYSVLNFSRMNPPSFFQKLFCCGIRNLQLNHTLDIPGMSVEHPPEPQDIVWSNIGVTICEIVLRKLITYFVCLILLGISFGMIYGLSRLQKDSKHITISLSISLVISIINILLNTIIQQLTLYQKDTTLSSYQISICIKITIAQLVNSILISMISARYIKNNIYQEGGLVDDVFYFSIVNAVVNPLIRWVNVYLMYLKGVKFVKSKPKTKLDFETQVEYNKIWELPEFELGLEYIYPLKTLIYTSFFISLQPIISIFSIIGITFMYFIEKKVLLYQSSRPKQASNIINQTTNLLLYFSIISYGLGNLTWTYFLSESLPKYTIIPNIIVIAIGLGMYAIRVSGMLGGQNGKYQIPLVYEEERLYFRDQYDRLNPVTRVEGLKSWVEYLNMKKSQIINRSKFLRESGIIIQNKIDKERDINAFLQIKKLIPQLRSLSMMTPPETVQSLTKTRLHIPRSNIHNSKLIGESVTKSKLEIELNNRNNGNDGMYLSGGYGGSNQMNSNRSLNYPMTESRMVQGGGGESDDRINHDRLMSVIEVNEWPGNQRPGMLSKRFNPIDYIEVVEEDQEEGVERR